MDVLIDVSLVRIVVSQGLYLSHLVLTSIVDDSLKLQYNCLNIIETFHLTLKDYCFFLYHCWEREVNVAPVAGRNKPKYQTVNVIIFF